MRRVLAIVLAVSWGCFCAVAQDASPPGKDTGKPRAGARRAASKDAGRARTSKDAAKPGTKAGRGKKGGAKTESEDSKPSKPAAPPAELKGDMVSLKSGAKLQGVQVVSQAANEIQVDVGAGVVMTIPRRLVVNIKFDNIDPAPRKPGDQAPQQQEVDLIGRKLKPEVSEKLTSPLPEPPLKYEGADFIVVLGELSDRLGITIEIDDAVKAIPAEERRWTFETKPGINLMGLLQDEFLKRFPSLDVVYQYDKLLVTTKDKAKEMALAEAAAAAAAAAAPATPPAQPQPAPTEQPAPVPPPPADQPAPAPAPPAEGQPPAPASNTANQ